jgi:hypothetical protein
MHAKDLIKILQAINEDADVFIELQQDRHKTGQTTVINSVEIEVDCDAITLKGLMNSQIKE